MKKIVLSSMMFGALAFTLSGLFSVPAFADCPIKAPCGKNCEKPTPPTNEFKKPMTIEERTKIKQEKKAEFEAKLQLSEEQKTQLEKIKADENKKLEPYRAKMKKLFEQERAIKKESIKKFEAILTPEQKAELEKIRLEAKDEMKKHEPTMRPNGQKPLNPECKCPCHKTNESCSKPSHKK